MMLVLASLPAIAQTTPPPGGWTLEYALQTAETQNQDFLALTHGVAESRAQMITAGARLNPTLFTDNGIAEKTYRLIGVQQTIVLNDKRKKRLAVAEAQLQQRLAEVETARLDLRAEVRKAYTALYNLQEKEREYRDLLRTSETLLEIARKREQAGDIPQVDVLQAEIIALNTRNDVESLTYQKIQAQNTFNLLLNLPIGSQTPLAPPNRFPAGVLAHVSTELPAIDLPPLANPLTGTMEADADQLIANAWTHRPEVLENQHAQTESRMALRLAQANRVPDLTLAAGPDLVSDGSPLSVFFMANVSLPIFNRQQGPIQEAQARYRRLEAEMEALKTRISLEVANAYALFRLHQRRLQRYEQEILPTAELVMHKSQRSFELGKSPILLALNAQQAYMNTRLGYLQSLAEFQNAISDLERAIGTAP